jgi:tRNA(Ile)-lysidine synthase TilS/MesJ
MYELLSETNTYILLGHNKDDCFENIITNITNKNSYNNLSGMVTLKTIDNLNFWRPMLNITKKDIIHFAYLNNIPHLCDSTPKWSVRGKIRDDLRPLLCNLKNNTDIQQDESTIESFFTLKEHIQESGIIINDIIINKLLNNINNVNNVLFGTYSIDDLDTLKYKSISKMFFTKLNINISNKTLNDFVEYLDRFRLTNNERKFMLNKNNIFMIKNSDNDLYKKIVIT